MSLRAHPVDLVWPWAGHEGCQDVHLMRLDGVLCGRVCKTCNEAETHFRADPREGGTFEGTILCDPIPVDAEGNPQQGGTA